MKIYLLTRLEDANWDEYDSFVVRAESGKSARVIANRYCGDEGEIWTDESLVIAREIVSKGKEKLILGSFNAG